MKTSIINGSEVSRLSVAIHYPCYNDFSDPRKTALVDMGFNLGVPKLKKEFVKFNDAVNRGDWNAAADESHRTIKQRGDKRNKDTYVQLRYNR